MGGDVVLVDVFSFRVIMFCLLRSFRRILCSYAFVTTGIGIARERPDIGMPAVLLSSLYLSMTQ